ncbi:ABC transporter permease [Pusillimonas caeni]|uniref:ABC transporter permease n=1 Tax=Pusillimonas caeni TaxID=1348472 RepID=UPI000E59D827|nr:ABC transporter permease [Pusillimonas caeni]TFL14782.1 ABC transporter permease [Pusillimonas caeni]
MRKDKVRRISMAAQERIIGIASPIVLLLVWQLLGTFGVIDERFVPTPASIARTMYEMMANGTLWVHLKASFIRIGSGFVIGSIVGVALGVLMGLSRWLRAALDPIVAAIYPIPKISLLPLVMVFFGLGEASKIFIIAFAVVFIVLINTMSGVMSISSIYFDVAKNYRASKLKLFTRIIVPGALPSIFVGLRLAIGVALILIVAAEFVAARAGIGYLIWTSFEVMRIEEMFVGIILITAIGLVTAAILKEIERRVLPWR